jgi:hemerythrin-like metal-binding protein
MARIVWTDEIFSVGMRKMDEQHKQLVDLINALDAKKDSADREFVQKILNTLVLYTKKHFVEEEKLLKKIHFPTSDSHIKQHQRFIQNVNECVVGFDKDHGNQKILDDILNFLTDWLTHHILVEDKSYGEYLNN